MSIILFLLAQSATPYGSPVPQILLPYPRKEKAVSPSEKERFDHCIDLAIDDPASSVAEANVWRMNGGGYLARHCLGFAYAEQQQWSLAANTFVEAAREAELAKFPRTADIWAQAGNAALAGGEPAKAVEYLTAALVQGTLAGLNKGEVHLDRARAYVALNDYPAARGEFALVHELAPQDPLGWLLSATLARRMDDIARAQSDIAEVLKLAPTDPAVLLEAGNIAYQADDAANAKKYWEQLIAQDPQSTDAATAKKYLDQLVAKPE